MFVRYVEGLVAYVASDWEDRSRAWGLSEHLSGRPRDTMTCFAHGGGGVGQKD
jgi:hypothetical protein